MIHYSLRPAFGSSKLLLEFTKGVEEHTFLNELRKALAELNIKVVSSLDLWMNDEVLYKIESNKGRFTLSINIWEMAFIMSEENQELIITIDTILSKVSNFNKVIKDFNDYK